MQKKTQQRQSLSAMTLRPSGNREALDLHRAQRHVDSRATYLDSDSGIQDTDCSLERLQEAVLVRDNTRYWPVWIRRQTPAWMFSAEGLNHASPCVCKQKMMRQRRSKSQEVSSVYLSEDMVQQSIIRIVIHGLVVLEQWRKLRASLREKALTGS